MSSAEHEIWAASAYSLACVEKTEAPVGAEGKNWYRYVIERATSTIVGQRRGTLQQVTSHAEAFVEELNARSSGRSASAWAPRRKK